MVTLQGKATDEQHCAADAEPEAQPGPWLLPISVKGKEAQMTVEDVINMDSAPYTDLWMVCLLSLCNLSLVCVCEHSGCWLTSSQTCVISSCTVNHFGLACACAEASSTFAQGNSRCFGVCSGHFALRDIADMSGSTDFDPVMCCALYPAYAFMHKAWSGSSLSM